MKKSLMALAVLGALSGAASAQSSVTVYGIMDLGLQWNKKGLVLPGATAVIARKRMSIDSGFQSGSRLGFRGSEALGRDWNAVFDLEMGFDVEPDESCRKAAHGAVSPIWVCSTARYVRRGPHRDAVVGHRRFRPVWRGRSLQHRLGLLWPASHVHPGELAARRQFDHLGVANLGRLQARRAVLVQRRLG